MLKSSWKFTPFWVLISYSYDVLKNVGGLSNDELAATFHEWNKGELESFLVEITADIFTVKDGLAEGELVDKVLDKTGMKGTGKWTVQQAADLSIAAPTIEASLDSRFLSGLKDERVAASKVYSSLGVSDGPITPENVDKKALIDDVRKVICFLLLSFILAPFLTRNELFSGPLCSQDLQLCSGNEHYKSKEQGTGMGPQPWRVGQNLEGRMHY